MHTRFDLRLKDLKNACLSLSLQKIFNQKGWKMEKMVKVMLLSLMLFTTFVDAESLDGNQTRNLKGVKNFYINDIGITDKESEVYIQEQLIYMLWYYLILFMMLVQQIII